MYLNPYGRRPLKSISAKKTQKLQSYQSQFLLLSVDGPWYVNNKTLLTGLQLPTTYQRVRVHIKLTGYTIIINIMPIKKRWFRDILHL